MFEVPLAQPSDTSLVKVIKKKRREKLQSMGISVLMIGLYCFSEFMSERPFPYFADLYGFHSNLVHFVVTYRRGSGGHGFISGAGETELQLQRRRFAY